RSEEGVGGRGQRAHRHGVGHRRADQGALPSGRPAHALVRLLQPRLRARRAQHGGVLRARDHGDRGSLMSETAWSRIYPKSPLGEREASIPTGRDVEWEPLVDYRRAGVSETTIHGAIAWASGGRVVHSFGGNVLCYGRSMMKPLMMKVFTDVLGDCTWEQKAIALA